MFNVWQRRVNVFFGVAFFFSVAQVSADCNIDEIAKEYSITAKNELFLDAYLKISVTHANTLVKRNSNRPVRIVFDVFLKDRADKDGFWAEAMKAGFVLDNESRVDIDGFKYYLLLGTIIEKDLMCIATAQALLRTMAIGKNVKVDFVQLEDEA